jgi:hypothetical protein
MGELAWRWMDRWGSSFEMTDVVEYDCDAGVYCAVWEASRMVPSPALVLIACLSAASASNNVNVG